MSKNLFLTASLVLSFGTSFPAHAKPKCLNLSSIFNQMKASRYLKSGAIDIVELDAASIHPIVRASRLKEAMKTEDIHSILSHDTWKQDGCKSLTIKHKAADENDVDSTSLFEIDLSKSNDKKITIKHVPDELISDAYSSTLELIGKNQVLMTGNSHVNEYVVDPISGKSCGVISNGPLVETSVVAWGYSAAEVKKAMPQPSKHLQDMLVQSVSEMLSEKGRCTEQAVDADAKDKATPYMTDGGAASVDADAAEKNQVSK